VRTQIAVVPQAPYLFHATLRDNLLVANLDASDAELDAACWVRYFDRRQWADAERRRASAAGNRPRPAQARLDSHPDEATTHLDAVTATRVWDALEHHMAGRMVLILDHSQRALAYADRTLKMN